jgi:hypothetical protein
MSVQVVFGQILSPRKRRAVGVEMNGMRKGWKLESGLGDEIQKIKSVVTT